MWLQTDQIAAAAKPGQFVSVYSNDASRILPRPISICEIDKEFRHDPPCIPGGGRRNGRVFHIWCRETAWTSWARWAMAFPYRTEENALLIGGGIGIPPMLELAKQWPVGEDRGGRLPRMRHVPAGRSCPACRRYIWQQRMAVAVRREMSLDAIRDNQTAGGRHLRLRPHPHAAGPESVCRRRSGIECWIFHGRADGLRCRRLSGLCLSSLQKWTDTPMCTTSASARTARYSGAEEVEL